jgi:hypothetical protein
VIAGSRQQGAWGCTARAGSLKCRAARSPSRSSVACGVDIMSMMGLVGSRMGVRRHVLRAGLTSLGTAATHTWGVTIRQSTGVMWCLLCVFATPSTISKAYCQRPSSASHTSLLLTIGAVVGAGAYRGKSALVLFRIVQCHAPFSMGGIKLSIH